MKKDILKVVAYFSVYGCDIYAVKRLGLDTGKNNLEDYFGSRYNWSLAKIKRIVAILKADYIVKKEPSDIGCTCLSLSMLYKTQIKYLEI